MTDPAPHPNARAALIADPDPDPDPDPAADSAPAPDALDMSAPGFAKSASPGYLANHMARLFARALTEAVGPLGLAPAQFMTLLELWDEDGLTQAELVARLDVEQATMAGTLGRMERDGLITRAPHPGDRRAQIVRLTDRARALRAPATRAAAAVNARALSGLSPDKAAEIVPMLRQIIETLRSGR